MTSTRSFGVSERKAGDSIDALLQRADADIALYAAKASGRNRVVAADPGGSMTVAAQNNVIQLAS